MLSWQSVASVVLLGGLSARLVLLSLLLRF